VIKKLREIFIEPFDSKNKIGFFVRRRIQPFLYKNFFKQYGKRTIIYKPLRIFGPKYISIGKNVTINKNAYLFALKVDDITPVLRIGDRTTIGHFSHIVSVKNINIGNDVLIADKVYIGDNSHNYMDTSMPISEQGVSFTGAVTIGDETWIGDNATIVSCNIGKHCVIGANSFVNRDIPDYSVACGNPVRIVKQFNVQVNKWEKV